MTGLSTTLPQNLRALMEEGRVDQALAELSHCEIGAREPGRGATALHITPCPDELVRRLVDRGEDVNAADNYGRRPPSRARLLGPQGPDRPAAGVGGRGRRAR